MSPVALVIAFLALGAVAVTGVRWFRRDIASVEHYQETLRALHDVTDAQVGVDGEVEITRHPRSGSHVRVLMGGGPRKHDLLSGGPSGGGLAHQTGPLPAPILSVPKARRWTGGSVRSGQTRLRIKLLTVTFAGAVLALGAVGVEGLLTQGTPHSARLQASAPPASRVVAPTPPGTTVPPVAPTLVVMTTSAPGTVSYSVTSVVDPALSVSALAPCWIELRAASSSGPLLYAGTLSAGAVRSFAGQKAVWLRLGYPPGVRITVDGVSVHLPVTDSPLDVALDSA